LLAGYGCRTCVRADEEDLGVCDGLVYGHHDIREGDAGDDVDLLAFKQLGGCLYADIGFELVVFAYNLDRYSTQLAVVLFYGQHERVVLVLPQCSAWAGQGADEADLDRLLRKACGG